MIKLRIRFERRPIKGDGIDETSGAYKRTAHNILPIESDENVQLAHLSLNRMIIFLLLYLHRARNKITQLSIPTHAQLQRHRLKFIKNV